jgi:hypothetical protein
VLVNARSITVAEHAKGDFMLGSFHKEIATYLVDTAESEETSDQDLIKVSQIIIETIFSI